MLKATVLAIPIAIAFGAGQSALPRVATLQELTVPMERLPAGCVLSPAESNRLDGNGVQGRTFWNGLSIPTNPWTGTDRQIVIAIAQRIHGPVVMPDGPLTARDLAAFRSRFADGVEQAYAANYAQSESDVAAVYAARFASAEMPDDRQRGARASTDPRVIRVVIGQIVAIASGDGGECFKAVGAHLRTLAN